MKPVDGPPHPPKSVWLERLALAGVFVVIAGLVMSILLVVWKRQSGMQFSSSGELPESTITNLEAVPKPGVLDKIVAEEVRTGELAAAAVPAVVATNLAPAPDKPLASLTNTPQVVPRSIVLVMDMSRSMNPFVQDTHRIWGELLTEWTVRSNELSQVSFGLWGFRGFEPKHSLGNDVTNFTSKLVDAERFRLALRNLSPTTLGEKWVDGMFPGAARAIRETRWNTEGTRSVIVVGDSSSYGPTDPRNVLKLDENLVRTEADQRGVRIFSILILNPRAAADHSRARAQYRAVADNRRLGFGHDYLEVTADPDSGISFADSYLAAQRRVFAAILEKKSL